MLRLVSVVSPSCGCILVKRMRREPFLVFSIRRAWTRLELLEGQIVEAYLGKLRVTSVKEFTSVGLEVGLCCVVHEPKQLCFIFQNDESTANCQE